VLSEALALGLMAALCAAWLRIRRELNFRTTAVAVGVVGIAALVRETVFLSLALPIGIAIAFEWVRKLHRSRASSLFRSTLLPVVACVAVIVPLLIVALKPGGAPFERGSTLTSFRTMNVIGQRILPDPYLRAEMRKVGMPDFTETQVELHKPRYSMDDNWQLFRTPELVTFAEEFPTSRFILAEVKRPRTFTRFVSAAFDRRVFDGNKVYGTNHVVPNQLSMVVWGWPATLHAGLFVVALTMLFGARRRLTGSEHSVAIGAVALTAVMGGAAILAHMLDAMERPRHVLPFWVFGRLALTVGVTILVTATLREPFRKIRKQASIQMDGQRRLPIVIGFVAGSIAALIATLLFAVVRNRPNPTPLVKSPTASAALVKNVESELRADGVVVSPRVHDMLGPLLRPWEDRSDLQAAFSTPEGSPDVARLSGWMRSLPDSSAEGFVPHLGALDELRGRMGIISPETGIGPVLFWSVQNARIGRDVSGVIWHVVDYCRAHVDVQAKFTSGDYLDVVGLLRHVAEAGSANPTAATDTPVLEAVLAKLAR
jgi:hypothetical protein